MFQFVNTEDFGSPVIGPSLVAVGHSSEDVTVSNVRIYGFEHAPPISRYGYGLSEEGFFSENNVDRLDSDFWNSTEKLGRKMRNWIRGNSSVGLINLRVARAKNHALNFWGYALDNTSDGSVSSNFRYRHTSGGDIESFFRESAFGLLISTDPDPSSGVNEYCSFSNDGEGLSLSTDLARVSTHDQLNVDTNEGGWSDWLRLHWQIEQGATNYRAQAKVFDLDGKLIYEGAYKDLNISNGTKIWGGYSTGNSSAGGAISGYSAMDRVEIDDFIFEQSFINEAPKWLDSPLTLYARAESEYSFNLRGWVIEPNKTDIYYLLESGPNWLNLDDDGNLSGTPTRYDIGMHRFSVRASDAEGMSSIVDLVVEVSGPLAGFYRIGTSHDVSVNKASPDDNFGNGRTILLQRPSNTRNGFLKFNLSDIENKNVLKAYLRLKVSSFDNGGNHTVWSVDDDTWSEETMNYTNQPALIRELASSGQPGDFSWTEFDITDQVKLELAGDKIVSLGVTSKGGFRGGYHSSEAMPGFRPEVIVITSDRENIAPVFNDTNVEGVGSFIGTNYIEDLSTYSNDINGDRLYYRILDGPSWLEISEDGDVFGEPAITDMGWNEWKVQVSDGFNPPSESILSIFVGVNDDSSGWAKFVSNNNLSGIAQDDSDSDGIVDLMEYALRGNVNDSGQTLITPRVRLMNNGRVEFSFEQISDINSGIEYEAQWTDDLRNSSWSSVWESQSSENTSDPSLNLRHYRKSVLNRKLFFRVKVKTL